MLSVEERAAQLMEHLCSHSAHGYSQPNRQGVGTGGGRGETVTLSDGSTVSISVGDRDCSSAAIECYAAQGVGCGGASYTGDMRRCMVASGNFEALPASTWRSPRRGDLLLTERNGHVAMALGNGLLGEFLRSENHSTHGAVGDQDGGESVVRALYDDGWDCVLRYCGPEPEEEPEAPSARGASVQLYDGNATDAQRWSVQHNDDGTVTLTALSCGLALDVQNGGTSSGTPVWVYTPNGTDSQRWFVYQKSGDYAPDFSRPVALVPKLNAGLRLDCVGGGRANGTGIQTYEANGTSAQEWSILDHGDGTWTLVNVGSSQALDVVGGGN